jgi:hypothetical protein
MGSAGHFIKHHPSESQGPQLNNADVGLLANVESERVNGHLLSLLVSFFYNASFQSITFALELMLACCSYC